MEPEISLAHLQVPATCPSPETSIQSMPPSHFTNIHLNVIVPCTPGSSEWSHSLRFSHQNLYESLLSPIRVTCPAHRILDLIARITLGEEYGFSSCSFLHSLSRLSGQSDHVSHAYKTTDKIIVLCILIFIVLDSNLKTQYSAPNDS
jgi:hypothetical protein